MDIYRQASRRVENFKQTRVLAVEQLWDHKKICLEYIKLSKEKHQQRCHWWWRLIILDNKVVSNPTEQLRFWYILKMFSCLSKQKHKQTDNKTKGYNQKL
jgi:hypothetical protein